MVYLTVQVAYYLHKEGLCNFNKLSNIISLVTFLFEQTLHIFGLAETWPLPSVTDSFVNISYYWIVGKHTPSQITKHGVCICICILEKILSLSL